MTRKDFEKIARAFSRARAKVPEPEWNMLQGTIADCLLVDNPAFDSVKFLEACLRPTE
jgi:hypothetical protein